MLDPFSRGEVLLRERVDPRFQPVFLADDPYLGAGRKETMDAYLPSDAFGKPRPAVLLIHGGGWYGGDKRGAREQNIGNTLAMQGYAVFSINYALNRGTGPGGGKGRFETLAWPGNLFDCKSALRYLRREANRFGIDRERIGVMGCSAGGHLAMMLSATAQEERWNRGGLYISEANNVACLINFYGPHYLPQPFLADFFERPNEVESRTILAEATPRNYFHKGMPPTLVAHGTADDIVPVAMGRELVAELAALGITHRYVEVPEGPHSFDLQPRQADLRPAVLGFLEEYLAARPR